MKEHCKEVIRNKGSEKITVDELAADITPHGRGMRSVALWAPSRRALTVLDRRPQQPSLRT